MKDSTRIYLRVFALVMGLWCSDFLSGQTSVSNIAGVYKHRFKNQDVRENQFWSEDILEIVELSPEAFYFKTHLEFFNGHLCNMFGVAKRVEPDVFEFFGETPETSAPCKMQFKVSSEVITFLDSKSEIPRCSASHCGARGGFDGIEFKRKWRRNIQYMPIILKSSDYKYATQSFSASPK